MHVLIVGGGIGGLATALSLHSVGIRCTVFEQVRELRELGVGINTLPHAIKELIEPGEVADVVAFLAGPGGRSFTGVPVTMDMGWTAR